MLSSFQGFVGRALASAVGVFGILAAGAAQSSVFYVVPHQDDWQLFMGQNAYDDAAAGNKVVFIYLTAGDAGFRAGGYGSIPYYRAREEGAKDSTRLPAAMVQQQFPAEKWERVLVLGRRIMRWENRNTVSYFLRLPDGAPNGAGFESNFGQSLERFRLGFVSTIQSVDGVFQFRRYRELQDTIKEIIRVERGSQGEVWLNTHEYDTGLNPTHSDHREAGILCVRAGVSLGGVNFALWQDYITAEMPQNIGTRPLIHKAGMLGALNATLLRTGYWTTFEPGHQDWLPRNYFRIRGRNELLP
ncbi:MAG: PIG-L family deacetylase [Fimbriimonadaceae bacterium]|nr:PIG-L family deacetylase [Fimbriimonadaceae bacterium]